MAHESTGARTLLALTALTWLTGTAAPERTIALAEVLRPFEGAAWLVVSGALVPVLLRRKLEPWQRRVFGPQHLAAAFGFAFAGAALPGIASVGVLAIRPEIPMLVSTLFVLTRWSPLCTAWLSGFEATSWLRRSHR